ncbi:MAG: hypothetical protein H7096_08255 [Flavobacterium sp.]|nr:hypothetical protein [Pedobacter sp.]
MNPKNNYSPCLSAIVILLLIYCLQAQAQTLPYGSSSDTATFMLNDKAVHIISYQYGLPHIRFIALHDTEKTGLRAAFKFMAIHGGYAVELQYGNSRDIIFTDSLKNFSFDPNKIFTPEGAYLGLAISSIPQIPTGMEEKIQKLGNEVLRFSKIDSLGFIIALHNNYDGGFSIYSYTNGNYLENTAEEVYINPDMDPDNFVYVTDRRFFNYLKQRKLSVILQSLQVHDDGSLSVYAMQNNIPYANVEIQHGRLDENYRFLLAINDMVKEIFPPNFLLAK